MWQLAVADDKEEEEEDMEAKYVPVEGDDERRGGGRGGQRLKSPSHRKTKDDHEGDPGGDHSKILMQVSITVRGFGPS